MTPARRASVPPLPLVLCRGDHPSRDRRSPEFRAVLDALGARRLRPEVTLREVPAPRRIAPWSVALTGEVEADRSDDPDLASGRFIVLYDPAGQEAWEGRFRVVTLVRATLEPEMAAEDMLAEVAWTWLEDALHDAGAAVRAEGGTVTRVLSQSFGALAGKHNDVELEMRASWTPVPAEGAPARRTSATTSRRGRSSCARPPVCRRCPRA